MWRNVNQIKSKQKIDYGAVLKKKKKKKAIENKEVLESQVSPAFVITYMYFCNHWNIRFDPIPDKAIVTHAHVHVCGDLHKDHNVQVPWKYITGRIS